MKRTWIPMKSTVRARCSGGRLAPADADRTPLTALGALGLGGLGVVAFDRRDVEKSSPASITG
jgi:hypothetical protein